MIFSHAARMETTGAVLRQKDIKAERRKDIAKELTVVIGWSTPPVHTDG